MQEIQPTETTEIVEDADSATSDNASASNTNEPPTRGNGSLGTPSAQTEAVKSPSLKRKQQRPEGIFMNSSLKACVVCLSTLRHIKENVELFEFDQLSALTTSCTSGHESGDQPQKQNPAGNGNRRGSAAASNRSSTKLTSSGPVKSNKEKRMSMSAPGNNEFDLSHELNTAIMESDKALIAEAKRHNDVAGEKKRK